MPTTFATPSPREPGDRPVGALVIAFSVLCALAILASLAFQVFSARTDVLRHHSQSATILVRVLEQQTIASLDAAELALTASERAIRLLPAGGPQRVAAIDQLFQTSIARLPYLRAMWLLDADGNVVQDSDQSADKVNLSDREYFLIHRDDPSLGLYIDRPMLSKQGVPFIGLSRRINRADGSFGGVIVASLEPDYLRRFYDTIRAGEQGMVALVRRDGTLMLRVPGAARAPREQRISIPYLMDQSRRGIEGHYAADSEVDDVERSFFYRHVARRPLLVVVGVGQDDMLADWRRTSWAYLAVSLGFLALVG